MEKIPLIILNAVNALRRSFGETGVEILDTDLIRKNGFLGVTISVHAIEKYYRVFLSYTLAEDIFVYGQHVADDFIFNIIKDDYLRYVRKKKLEKISKYE